MQLARPVAARRTPRSFVVPIEPAQATPLGRIGRPPAVTATRAVTATPARGLRGTSVTAPARAGAAGRGVGEGDGAAGLTKIKIADALLPGSGSVSEACAISARYA